MKRCKLGDEHEPLLRCGQPVFVLTETLACIASKACIPCCHKVCSGHELLPKSKPNTRPEMCPRSSGYIPRPNGVGLFPAGNVSILTVGDGDLSFSLSLAQHMANPRNNLVATTFESEESILRAYPQSGQYTLKHLRKFGVPLLHGVDAHYLTPDLFPFRNKDGEFALFDFIVFNFPCVAVPEAPGLDGQLKELKTNQRLLKKFGRCAAKLLKPSGHIHVTHKTKASFQHWNVPHCLTKRSGLNAQGALVFDRCAFPGYVNRKAQDSKSFPMTDALTFLFGKEEEEHNPLSVLLPNESLVDFVHRLESLELKCAPLDEFLLELVKLVLIQ